MAAIAAAPVFVAPRASVAARSNRRVAARTSAFRGVAVTPKKVCVGGKRGEKSFDVRAGYPRSLRGRVNGVATGLARSDRLAFVSLLGVARKGVDHSAPAKQQRITRLTGFAVGFSISVYSSL